VTKDKFRRTHSQKGLHSCFTKIGVNLSRNDYTIIVISQKERKSLEAENERLPVVVAAAEALIALYTIVHFALLPVLELDS